MKHRTGASAPGRAEGLRGWLVELLGRNYWRCFLRLLLFCLGSRKFSPLLRCVPCPFPCLCPCPYPTSVSVSV